MIRPEMRNARRRVPADARWAARPLLMVRRALLSVALVSLVLVLAACEDTTPSPAQRAELERIVLEYLNDLAEAYSTGDLSTLERHASGNEINEVKQLLEKLQMTGDRLQATLLHAEVDDTMVFRRVNATVSLTEVWDVARYDAFTGHEKGRNPRSIQSSVIQLRMVDGQWKVIGRRVMETQSGSAWSVTPMPEPEPEPEAPSE